MRSNGGYYKNYYVNGKVSLSDKATQRSLDLVEIETVFLKFSIDRVSESDIRVST